MRETKTLRLFKSKGTIRDNLWCLRQFFFFAKPLRHPRVDLDMPPTDLLVGDHGFPSHNGSDLRLQPPVNDTRICNFQGPVATKALELGNEAVNCCNPNNLYSLPLPATLQVILRHDVDIIMRKIVKKTVQEKQILFQKMTQDVMTGLRTIRDFRDILTSVIQSLVDVDARMTWGRVVTAYAFGGFFANEAAKVVVVSSPSAQQLGKIVGEVIYEVAGDWIEAQGGWPAFVRHFEMVIPEEGFAKGLMVLGALSLGALSVLSLGKMIK